MLFCGGGVTNAQTCFWDRRGHARLGVSEDQQLSGHVLAQKSHAQWS